MWPRKTVRRATRSPVGAWASVSDALLSAKQCENQGVDPGPWGWVSGVTLELVPKRTRNNQTEKGEKASGQKGWRCERV